MRATACTWHHPGASASLLGTTTRKDGTLEVTYAASGHRSPRLPESGPGRDSSSFELQGAAPGGWWPAALHALAGSRTPRMPWVIGRSQHPGGPALWAQQC